MEVQKDILANQLEDEAKVGAEREQLQEDLGGIEERWESDRSGEAAWAKWPFLASVDSGVVENGYGIAMNSNRVSTQIQHRETVKWKNWRAKPTEDQWQWLEALSLFHRRRPVLDITEELGWIKREEELPGRSGGEEERDLNISDRRRHPMLTIQEKAKLLNCDRQCEEDEWTATPSAIKWGTLEILKFAYRGEGEVKLEGDTGKVAPVSANPPPPEAPPSTYSRDRAAEKDRNKGKEKIPKESRSKEKEGP